MATHTATPGTGKNLDLLNNQDWDPNQPYSIGSDIIKSYIPTAGGISVAGGIPIANVGDNVTAFPPPDFIDVQGHAPSHFTDLTNAGPWVLATLRVDDVVQATRAFPTRGEAIQVRDYITLDIFGQPRALAVLRALDFATLSKSHSFSVSERVYVYDYIQLIVEGVLTEVLDVNDVVSAVFIASNTVSDGVQVTDQINGQLVLNRLIAEAIKIVDVIKVARLFLATSSLTVTDTISQIAHVITNLVEAYMLVDTVSDTRVMTFVNVEELDVTDSQSTSLAMWEHITEQLFTYGLIEFDSSGTGGDEVFTFVINSMTKGVSEYTNYEFNSLSGLLAAKSDGIYSVVGSDDAGTQIDALVRTGLMDFDSNAQKQVPYAYIGLNKAGSMMLKTITDWKGNRKERWYKVSPRAVDATDTIRVNMGKGVKSRYWQFELTNFEGADFELADIELLPLQLTRRI